MHANDGFGEMSLPLPDYEDNGAPIFFLAEKALDYAKEEKLGSAVRIQDNQVVFDSPKRLLGLPTERLDAIREAISGEPAKPAGERGGAALPDPKPYAGPYTDAIEYLSEEYADATTLDEAIALRGFKAFVEDVTPNDFSPLPQGIERAGIADLWSQSTWSNGFSQRETGLEKAAYSVGDGDLLVVAPIAWKDTFPDEQNWNEIQDLGFGFYGQDGTLLPYTPFHDYDQNLFINALLTLDEGQSLACVVRESTCNGEDGINEDPCFCWRVYSCKLTVAKVIL